MNFIDNPKELKACIDKHQLQNYMDLDLYSIARLCSFEKNEYLIRTGEISDYLFFMIRGDLLIMTNSADDKNACIDYHPESILIGEAASLWKIEPNTSVMAVTSCLAVGVNLSKYRHDLINDLKFLQHVCKVLSYRLNNKTYLTSALIEPVNVRLAKFILNHSKSDLFSMQLTTSSAIINTSYRHLLRILKNFCQQDILCKEEKGYRILDREALKDIVRSLAGETS